jgi:hypothetical protein
VLHQVCSSPLRKGQSAKVKEKKAENNIILLALTEK